MRRLACDPGVMGEHAPRPRGERVITAVTIAVIAASVVALGVLVVA